MINNWSKKNGYKFVLIVCNMKMKRLNPGDKDMFLETEVLLEC